MGGLAQQSFIDNKKSKVIKDQGWIQLRKHNIVQKKKDNHLLDSYMH